MTTSLSFRPSTATEVARSGSSLIVSTLVRERLHPADVFGIRPAREAVRAARLTFRGDPHTPRSRFDTTALRQLQPGLSLATWIGLRRADGLVPILNYFNRTQTPPQQGWSVRVTQVRDFRGGGATYDSHNGTDLVVPVGTTVVAPAPGRVVRVSNEWNRGGLKVVLDHGDGLVTMCNHLARALVREGDLVRRCEPIALSGASGVDALLLFPWNTPHVHFNVWLDGVPVDPFAASGEVPIFRGNEAVRGASREENEAEPRLDALDGDAVAEVIAHCVDPALRVMLAAIDDVRTRAFATMFHANYYPTRFPRTHRLYREAHARAARLDLPFRLEDVKGVVHRAAPARA